MISKQGIYSCLKQFFGFEKFKGEQENVVESVLQGHDTFVLMPTGGGKSLCYQLPALMEDGTAVVVSPLISLMKNQVDALRSLLEEDSVAHFMNSTLSRPELANVQKDVLDGRTKLLYVAPETLAKRSNLDFFSQMNVSFYAVDEAHCISEWGHDFRADYRNIRPSINFISLRKIGVTDDEIDRLLEVRSSVRMALVHDKLPVGDLVVVLAAMSDGYTEDLWAEFFSTLSRCGTFDNGQEPLKLGDVLEGLEKCNVPSSGRAMLQEALTWLRRLAVMQKALAERPPIVALTSTATEKVGSDILKNLGMSDVVTFRSSFNRPNLYYEVRPKTKDVDKEVVRFVSSRTQKSGIIYCLSRKEVERLAQVLLANNIKAAPYHAGLEPHERSQTQDDFLMEKVNVIVATVAFGMGIDKPDVRFVIHYDIPKSIEGYYQETGRAGRDGGEGYCLMFYSNKDLHKLEKFVEDKASQEQEIGRQLLKETAFYAESSACRRKILLHYFGEEYDKDNCGNCDNCNNNNVKVEAKEQLCSILKIVLAVKQNFAEDYILDIVSGRETDMVSEYGHADLELFGVGENDDRLMWQSVIRNAVLAEYLEKDRENKGALRVTPKGRKFLDKPTSFVISKDVDYDDDSDNVCLENSCEAVDNTLYQMLVELRKEKADDIKKPPYVIFQDSSLSAMATTYPVTNEELLSIPGVGQGKVKKYGKEFCELIRKYCEENEIERPEDFRCYTLPNVKSKFRITIIQNIDRKVDLDDFAETNRLDFSDLLSEIEAIVYSGTKINIDYFLNEIMEKEKIDEICAYFDEAETDDIDLAVNELGDDFSEEEIRLVRIKYMSDNAN